MPFIKGRQKTGGRSKNSSGRKSDKLIDQLKAHGFNYVKELAHALHDLPLGSGPVGTKYTELKSLLPFMAPKLREKDVEFTAPTEAQQAANRPISDEDLLKAMEHGKPKQSASRGRTVEAGNPVMEISRGAETYLPDVAGIQKAD